MAINLTVEGVTYAYPEDGDSAVWGDDATNWAQSVTNNALFKDGGTFTLTNELDFGASNGIASLYYKTRSSSLADAGEFRLANTDVISWRNNADSGNLDLGPGTDDILEFNGSDLVDVDTTQSLSNKSFSDSVGIGTASPSSDLHIEGSSGTTVLKIEDTSANSTARLQLKNDAVSWFVENLNDNFVLADPINNRTPVTIESNGVDDSLYINSSGNVGIGTNSPSTELEVEGEATFNTPGSGTLLITGFGGSGATLEATTGALQLDSSNPIVFSPGGSEKARFEDNGDFGFGTSSPATPFHIRQSGAILRIDNPDNSFTGFDFDVSTDSEASISTKRSGGSVDILLKPTSGGTPFEAMRLDSDGDVTIATGDVTIATGDVNLAQDPTSDLHAATKQYVDDKHIGTLEIVQFTSKIDNGTFGNGWEGWGASLNSDGRVYIRKASETSGSWWEQHTLKLAQIPIDTATAESKLDCLQHFAVDKDKALVIGGGGYYSGGGTGNFDVIVRWFDESNQVDSTDTVSVSVPQDVSLDGENGEYIAFFEADGGANQPIPSDAVGADVSLENVDASGTSYWIFQLYAIPEENFPYPRDFSGPSGTSQTNGGTGTHEALTVGSNCYVLAHPYDMVAKYDSDLVRTDEVSVNQRPHDITVDTSSGNLWVVTNEIGNGFVEEIDPSTMSVLNSYQLDSSRAGFGITYDSGTLYAGIGADGSETPAIVSIDPSDGSQVELTTDVNGGGANIPVKVTDGSLWSINSADSSTSEVKRYTLSGTTEATITAGIGKIYGLDTNNGADSNYVWAHGEKGVVKIDPSTDSVVQTYTFKLAYGGGTNVKKVGDYIYGGSRNSVAWTINTNTDEIIEKQMPLGTIKWVEEFNGNTLIGWSFAPYLMLVK